MVGGDTAQLRGFWFCGIKIRSFRGGSMKLRLLWCAQLVGAFITFFIGSWMVSGSWPRGLAITVLFAVFIWFVQRTPPEDRYEKP